MSTVARNRRRRKRGVTRRVRDEKGNIIVKRYAKKQSRFRIPGLKWSHAPQLAVGLPLLFHSFGTYLYKEGRLQPGDLFYDWFDSFNLYTGLTRLLVTGTLGFLIPLLIGYPIVTKGFKIRYWSAAWRQLVVIWAISLIFLAIFSPFINEIGVIRQQSDDEFVINDNNYDLSNLDSPFYAELLNGILDLLGNIPNPEEEVAYIYPRDEGTLDPDSDRFLYRWRVAETYNEELADFEQGFPNFRNDLIDFSQTFASQFAGNLSNARHLEIAEQYLTISTEYSGEALTPWNSEYGSPVGSTANLAIETLEESEASIVDGTGSGYIDINEQPFLSAQISEPRTQGYLSYDAYFIQDDKQAIKNEAVLLSDLEAQLANFFSAVNYNQRFNDLSSEGSFDSIWGEASLPGGSTYRTLNNNFLDKYNEFAQTINENTTVFDLILGVSNEIQSAILSAIADDSLPIDGTGEGTGVAPAGTDKAYWFFDSLVDETQTFGIEEAIAGFVNMLRAFKIPARPVLGFSVGDFQNSDGTSCSSNCDQILVQFEHIHVWIEALIPRINGDGDLIFSWGIFNPIPDPHILSQDSTDFEFGRNALGGAPDIELEITSGIATNFTATFDFGPFGERSGVLQNQVGTDVEGRIRVLYDGVPSSGQSIDLKLITESEIFDSEVTPDIGIDITSVTTGTSSDGWTDFKFFVATNGSVWAYDGSEPNIDVGVSVGLMDPLGSPGSLGVYAIIGTYGLSFGGDVTGFSLNATFTLDADTSKQTVIHPDTLEFVDAYGILKNQVVNFTITVSDPDGFRIPDVEGIQLMMIDEGTAGGLIANLIANALSNQDISDNSIGTFTTTDANGQGFLIVDYSLEAFATSQIYALVAVLQQGSLYTETLAWYSDDLDLSSILRYGNVTEDIVVDDTINYENGMFISDTIDFFLDTNATGLESAIDPQFTPVPAEGIVLEYYILEESVYNTYVNGFLPDIAFANLDGANVLTTCGTTKPTFVSSGCYTVQTGTLTVEISFTNGFATDSLGQARSTIHLENSGFATGYYYILVVAPDFNTLASTVRFISTSPPALELFSFSDGNKIEGIHSNSFTSDINLQNESLLSSNLMLLINRSELL